MPKVGDMGHSTSASEDLCQGEMPKADVRSHLKPMNSQKSGNYCESVHVNINVDSNTHYDAFEDVYVPGEFKNPDTSINAVSVEQYFEEYIRPNDDI